MASQYVVTDRTTADKQAIQVDDGVLLVSVTADAASAEPIVEDLTTGGHWKIFVDDGVLGIEATATVRDDTVELEDITISQTWLLFVDDGILGITSTTAPVVVGRFKVQKSFFTGLTVRANSAYLSNRATFQRQTVKI